MNNMFLGGIGSVKKALRKDYDFSDAEFRKYFIQNPQMNKLFLSAYNWAWSGGSVKSYDRKMTNPNDNNKLWVYHYRFEKLAEKICEKLGVDYNSSNIEIATFNDALSNERSYFSIK